MLCAICAQLGSYLVLLLKSNEETLMYGDGQMIDYVIGAFMFGSCILSWMFFFLTFYSTASEKEEEDDEDAEKLLPVRVV
jgi:hypothetical protein